MLTPECCGVSADPSLCYPTFSTSHFDPRYASFQRICGLLGPRSHQKADCWRAHRKPKSTCGYREGPSPNAGRNVARGPHLRRSAKLSVYVLSANATYRVQTPRAVFTNVQATG